MHKSPRTSAGSETGQFGLLRHVRVKGEPVEVERRQSNTPLSEDQPREGEEGRGRD